MLDLNSKKYLHLLLLLHVFLFSFSISAQAQEKDSIHTIERLEDIPATQVDLDPNLIEYPYVAYGIGPEYTDPIQFDEQLKKGLVALKLTNEELKFSYSNDYHGMFIHFAQRQSPSGVPLDLAGKEKLLVFNNYISGLVRVYRKKASDSDWTYIGDTGSAVAYRKRLVRGLALAIPIELDAQESVYYFISRFSHHRFDASARMVSREQYRNEEDSRTRGYMFYMGAIFSLLLFNFLIFISLRDSIYFYYCFFLFSIMMAGLSLTGFVDYLFAPFYIVPSENLFVFTSLSLISSVMFASRFYNLREYSKPLTIFQNICIGLVVLNLVAYLGPWYDFCGGSYLGLIVDILIVLCVIAMLSGAVVSLRRGNTMAKFYLASWIFMFSGAFVYIGHFLGIFSRNFVTSHGVLWGNLLEMIIVSLGMAYKISILDREKKEALILARGKKEYQRMVRVLLHDLSNPISLVQYYVGLKQNRPDDFERRSSKAWEKIRFGLTKLSEIIHFHREQEIQINKLTRTVTLGPVLVREVLIEVELMFEEKLEKKNLEFFLDGNVDVFVSAERVSLINEVFNNIISNAIKFSPEGGKITVRVETGLDSTTIDILDEGSGLSEEQMLQFQAGEIIDSTVGTKGERGTGFGLSLARGYMRVYEGSISLNHRYNSNHEKIRGTHVQLTFNRV